MRKLGWKLHGPFHDTCDVKKILVVLSLGILLNRRWRVRNEIDMIWLAYSSLERLEKQFGVPWGAELIPLITFKHIWNAHIVSRREKILFTSGSWNVLSTSARLFILSYIFQYCFYIIIIVHWFPVACR